MTKRLLLLIAMLLGIFTSLQAAEGEKQLQYFLKGLSTLQADFQQTLQQTDGDGVFFSTGTFYLKRPGQLRWEYAPPNEQLIVADGKRIWLHDIELDQISHRSQKAVLDGTPAQLLSDPAPVEKHFQLKDLGEIDGIIWLELTPRDEDSQFNSVRIGLLDNELTRMEMSDNFGQTTRFTFTNVKRNPILQDELFRFHPPSGIDLIGDL